MRKHNTTPIRRTIAVASTVMVALAVTTGLTTNAVADDGQADADQTATVIAAVAPDTGATVMPSTINDVSTATTAATQVTIPGTPDGDITLTSTAPADQALPPVTISLPKEVKGKHGKRAKNGTIVYSSTSDSGADVAVQVLSDGSVRLQTVTRSSKGALKFTYTFGDAKPQLQTDGSVALVKTSGDGSVLVEQAVATIAPAWARDAEGRPVATHYEVRGNGQLVQVISPDKNTAYPIVADPQVSYAWYGIHVYFNRSETNQVGYGASLVGIAGAAIPSPYTRVIGIISGGYAATANYYAAQGKCLEITIMYFPTAWLVPTGYSGGNCR